MRRVRVAVAVLLAATTGGAAQTMFRAPAASDRIEIVEHVDVLPDRAAQAEDAISAYAGAARHEPGALRIDAMREVRQNHFDLVEVWRDEAAYRAHQARPAMLHFREAVGSWLGSPIDERVGTPLAP